MQYWWVNRNQTYKQEVPGGYMWSPKANRNGVRNQFYDNMQLVNPGDVVFSFCDTLIKAVGIAAGKASTADRPLEFGKTGEYWDKEGWLVPVEFTELASPLKPKTTSEKSDLSCRRSTHPWVGMAKASRTSIWR